MIYTMVRFDNIKVEHNYTDLEWQLQNNGMTLYELIEKSIDKAYIDESTSASTCDIVIYKDLDSLINVISNDIIEFCRFHELNLYEKTLYEVAEHIKNIVYKKLLDVIINNAKRCNKSILIDTSTKTKTINRR